MPQGVITPKVWSHKVLSHPELAWQKLHSVSRLVIDAGARVTLLKVERVEVKPLVQRSSLMARLI